MGTVEIDTCCLSRDKYGCEMLLVRKEHLEKFSSLIAWIRKKGYGQEVGLLKLRLNSDDRQDQDNIKKIVEMLKIKFSAKCYNSTRKKEKVFLYNPDCQLAFKAAENDHIYQYVRTDCTASERKDFVEKAVQLDSYNDQVQNCWFGFPPKYFGLIDIITSGFKIDRGHAGCRALLTDHKVLVADPEYFRVHHGVPYVMIVQEPGDFIITFPFALHSGFNLGNNIAIAGNFADKDWIEEGMYAPVCDCNDFQVRMNLTSILKECRPDLLEKYLRSTSLMFPPGHPRNVIRCPLDPPVTVVEEGTKTIKPNCHEKNSVTSQKNHTILVPGSYKEDPPAIVVTNGANTTNIKSLQKTNATSQKVYNISLPSELNKKSPRGFKERTLYCPKCNQSFKENKIDRLKRHISKSHSNDEHLLHLVNIKYKPWKPKGTAGYACKLCGVFRRGSITHIRGHHLREHSNAPFEGAVKKMQTAI